MTQVGSLSLSASHSLDAHTHAAAKQVDFPEEAGRDAMQTRNRGLRTDRERGLKDWAGRGKDEGNPF